MREVKATYQAPDVDQSVTCKFEADLDVASDYQRLVSKLTKIFPDLAESNFTIHCPDSGGDTIVAAAEEDIFIALGSIPPGGTLNIVIQGKQHPVRVAPRSALSCAACGASLFGHRYTCTVCRDLYLCATCEQHGRHSHHPVMRTTTDQPPRASSQRTRLWDMGCHRHSPLFEDLGPRQRAARPFGSGFFHCLNPTAFEEFHQMAADLTRAWCGSMPPPTSNTHSSYAHSSQTSSGARQSQPTTNHTRSTDAQQQGPGYHVYTKSEEFDQGLFTKMVDEMTEKMNSTMDNIGEKHKASNSQTAKDGKQYHHSDENSPSDFEQMAEMLSPMMKDLIGAVGGEGSTQQDVHGQNGHQENQNKESVISKKEVEPTSAQMSHDAECIVPETSKRLSSSNANKNKEPDTESGSHITSKRQSSPCANNQDPAAELGSCVASKRQSSPCANNNDPPTVNSGSSEQSTAGRADNLQSIPCAKDKVLPDPPRYATIQKGYSLYPKVGKTNNAIKNKEDTPTPTTTGIPRFNTEIPRVNPCSVDGTSSHNAHNGTSNPPVLNKTSSKTTSGQSSSNSTTGVTGIRLPNLKAKVQTSSHTDVGQSGSYATNEEQSTPCGNSTEKSTYCGTKKGYSSNCNSIGKETPNDSSKEGSGQSGKIKELSGISTCKGTQPSANIDKAKHKDIIITNNVQPRLSVFKGNSPPGTLDLSAQNRAHGVSNKQCRTATTNDEQVLDRMSDGTESNRKCPTDSIQPASEDTNPGQVVTQPHITSAVEEQCQEQVSSANIRQPHSSVSNPRPSSIPQLSAKKSLPSTSNSSDAGYSSAKSTHMRRPYFDPRGGSAANKSLSRVQKPPHGGSKRGKTCHCGNPFNTKFVHRLTSPCSEPTPGTSSTPDIASTSDTTGHQLTEDEKLADALDSLETMGFADVGGSLTELLKEEDYDVWRVLERVLTY